MTSIALSITALRRQALVRPQLDWATAVLVSLAGVALTHRSLFMGDLQASRDLTRIFVPQSAFLRERLLAGELPLWNPYLRLGQPFIATLDTQALYLPRVLLTLAFGAAWGVNLQIALHAAIASIGAYLAARALGARPGTAYVALLYGLTPMFDRSGQLLALSSSAAWSGFVLLGAARRSTFTLALALGASCLCGAPEMIIWQCMMALSVAGRSALAGIGLGLGLGAAVFLPAGELAAVWGGGEMPVDPLAWSASFPQLLSMGWLFADQPRGAYWGPDQWLFPTLFVGAIPCLLAAFGFRRRTRALFAVAMLFALLALGASCAPSAALLSLPPLALFRYPAKYLAAVAFIVAVLAPFGLGRLKVWSRRPGRFSPLLGATLALFLAGMLATRAGPWRAGISEGFLWFGIAGTLAAGCFAAKRPGAIVALAFVECAAAHLLMLPSQTLPADVFERSSSVAAKIRADGPGRVSIAEEVGTPARLSRERLLPLRWAEEHLRAVEGYGFRDPRRLAALLDGASPGTYDVLGVTHFVRRPGARLLRSSSAFPRAYVVQQAARASDAEALEAMQLAPQTLRRRVLLAEGTGLDGPPCDSAVAVDESRPEHVTVRADVCEAGVLVLSDGWFPGWKVSIDGHDAPLWRADLLLRATPVTKGHHEIVFTYRPFSLYAGGGGSLLALLALVLARVRAVGSEAAVAVAAGQV